MNSPIPPIDEVWVADFARRLRAQWPRLLLPTLEEAARELWPDSKLRALSGGEAAERWLCRSYRRYLPVAA